jgi:hypothetical protein
MGLPKYSYPTYTLTVPSNGKSLKYRPFLVKDEKNLLLSQQSEELMSMYETLKSVIASCIVDDTKIESLAVFDLEYIFTQLRCKSIGEQVELIFTCQNEECKKKEPHTFAIEAKVEKVKDHTNKIHLFDNVGIFMKYPGSEQMMKLTKSDMSNPDDIIELIVSCIDYIYDDETIYHAKEQSKKELVKFVEELPRSAADKLRDFFATIPKLKQTVMYKCKHCETESAYDIEGIENFF